MDLRIIKTRLQIKEAFLRLRARLMPEKIKVKDICEEAQINKTTFYKHYTDSMELSNEIDDSVIDSLVLEFSQRDKLFENPNDYIKGLLATLEAKSELLKKVFRGKYGVMCSKLEEKLRSFYSDRAKNDEEKIKLSFTIGGFVRVVNDYLFNDKAQDIEKLTEYTVKIIESIVLPNGSAANANA